MAPGRYLRQSRPAGGDTFSWPSSSSGRYCAGRERKRSTNPAPTLRLRRMGGCGGVRLVVDDGLTCEAAAAASNMAKSTCWEGVRRWLQGQQRGNAARWPASRTDPRGSTGALAGRSRRRRRGSASAARGPAEPAPTWPGWEYVHSIVDDCSRLAYSEIHHDERARTSPPSPSARSTGSSSAASSASSR